MAPSREPLISLAPTVGSEITYLSSGAEMPEYVYIQPPPVATSTPAAAPATAASVPTSAPTLATASEPAPPIASPAPIYNRVVWGLGHEATCACLDAHEVKRPPCRICTTAWISCRYPNMPGWRTNWQNARPLTRLFESMNSIRPPDYPRQQFISTIKSCRGGGIVVGDFCSRENVRMSLTRLLLIRLQCT